MTDIRRLLFAEGVSEEEGPRIIATMADELADFLRAGGVISLSDWVEMNSLARVAAVRAGNVVHGERAAAVVAAARAAEAEESIRAACADAADHGLRLIEGAA